MTALLLLVLYLAVTAWLALRPLDVLWVSPANLEPLATLREDVEQGPEEAGRVIFLGMLRLAPLGVLVPLLGRRFGGPRFVSLVHAVFAGAAISLALEFGQSLVPSRVANVDSVILDALGVALTHQLCYRRLRSFTCRASCPGERRAAPPSRPVPPGPPAPLPSPEAHRESATRRCAWGLGRHESTAPALTGRG
ncbi:VanZ family protein [Streptomyces hoynatensis]|uniref:VanZ family protein n=1 Tax=Streptomyces hoynatensis TaxID=1141874 RepID=A0A3A9ZEQ5_9ACTN|nr:VanZ family protein [Streptomyces hoynatensis]RKN46901.1 VanZ family protein [Streptomyces hoynatensis]